MKQTTDLEQHQKMWCEQFAVSDVAVGDIAHIVAKDGTLLYNLVHGAKVYDYQGMNLCLTNCLTHDANEDTVRQLIFYPNGRLYTDWQYKGSILL